MLQIFIRTLLTLSFFFNYSLAQNLEKVSLQLQWKYQFQFAGFIVAKERGYYSDVGLDVELIEYDNTNTIQDLVDGKVDFAINNSILVYSDKKLQDVSLLSTYFQRSPLVIIAQPEIKTVLDLKGKSITMSENNLYNTTIYATEVGFYSKIRTNMYNSIISQRYSSDPWLDDGIVCEDANIVNSNVYGFGSNYICGDYIGVNVTTNVNGDPCDCYNNISMYPLFVDTANGDFRLQADSPCIDAGTNTIAGYVFPQIDLDGNHRIWDGDNNSSEIVDMGAYEFGSEMFINSPTNAIINVVSNTLTIDWDLMPGATSYYVYHSDDPYGTFELAGTVATNTWNTTIDANTKKFYQIVASSDGVK